MNVAMNRIYKYFNGKADAFPFTDATTCLILNIVTERRIIYNNNNKN